MPGRLLQGAAPFPWAFPLDWIGRRMHRSATQNSKIINRTRIRSIVPFKALKQKQKCKLKNYKKCNDFTRLLRMNITYGY